LNADDLTPHETIRADLATVLRLWLDGSQSALLAGGNADPVKMRTYLEMRRRGDLAGDENSFDFQRRRRLELEAEVERLRGEIAALKAAGAALPGEPGASTGKNLPQSATTLSRWRGRRARRLRLLQLICGRRGQTAREVRPASEPAPVPSRGGDTDERARRA
jgi:hypothetical protein